MYPGYPSEQLLTYAVDLPLAQVISSYPRPVNEDPRCQYAVDRYVNWGEAQTMIYLKISLSDFFTVFAARCRSWYASSLHLLR